MTIETRASARKEIRMPKKSKKTVKTKTTKKAARTATRKPSGKTQHACTQCGELGHNVRSHQPGGRLA
jgi:hypothetical protein